MLSIALLLPPLETIRGRLLQPDPLLPPELRPRGRRWLEKPFRWLTASLATSLAAWLGSLPLIAYYFHLLTPISLLANLVVVPLGSLALMSNLGSLLCGGWCPWLNELFNHSGWFWMEAMIKSSEWFAALPGAYFYVKAPPWLGFVVYYALLFGTLTGWLFAPRRRTVSRSSRPIRARGNSACNCSSSFSEPDPKKKTCSLPHLGHTRGTAWRYPQ